MKEIEAIIEILQNRPFESKSQLWRSYHQLRRVGRGTFWPRLKQLESMGVLRIERPNRRDHRVSLTNDWRSGLQKLRSTLSLPQAGLGKAGNSEAQRILLESELAKCRTAAMLALHLFSYCEEHYEGHGPRCINLAGVLGIRADVKEVMEIARTNPRVDAANDLMRRIDRKVREHHGNMVGASFAICHWASVACRGPNLSEQSKARVARRVLDEMKTLTGGGAIVTNVESLLNQWTSGIVANEESKVVFELLNLYAANLWRSHGQNIKLNDLLGEHYSIDSAGFQQKAKQILAPEFGTVRISSGSEDFEDVVGRRKAIIVAPGSRLRGGLRFRIENKMPRHFIAPFTEVRSWGQREREREGWRQICKNFDRVGEFSYPENDYWKIDLRVPDSKGNYFILFAFREETEASYVASATYWKVTMPIWNDAIDLRDLNDDDIGRIQKEGHAEILWLYEYGYAPTDLPGDAVRLIVR